MNTLEIIGLPGAGKSWFLQIKIHDMMPNVIPEEVPIGWNIEKILNILIAIKSFYFIFPILLKGKNQGLFSKWRGCLLLLERVGRKRRLSQKSPKTCIDEGVMQALWGLCRHKNHFTTEDKELLRLLILRLRNVIDRLFYISAHSDLIYLRLNSREKKTGFAFFVGQTTTQEYFNARSCMAMLLKLSRETGIDVAYYRNH